MTLRHYTLVESLVGALLLAIGFYLFLFRIPGHALFRIGGVMLIAGIFPVGIALSHVMK